MDIVAKHASPGPGRSRQARYAPSRKAQPWPRGRPQHSTCKPGNRCRMRNKQRDGGTESGLQKCRNILFARLREAEVVHARWAMLGIVGVIVPDLLGVKVPLVQDLLQGPWLPCTVIATVTLSIVESYRLAFQWLDDNADAKVYPGKAFDVLGVTKPHKGDTQLPVVGPFSSWIGGPVAMFAERWSMLNHDITRQELDNLKSGELTNGRIAMLGFLGCYMSVVMSGKGPITALSERVLHPLATLWSN